MSYPYLRFSASALLLAVSSGCFAVDDERAHFLDLRIGVSSSPSPDITEKVTSGGASSRFDWQGAKSHGVQGEIAAFGGCLHPCGGSLVLGLSLPVARYDSTPAQIVQDNGTVFSTGSQKLRSGTAGVDFSAGVGWWSSQDPEEFSFYGELAPFAGGGGAYGETAGLNSAGNLERFSGFGYFYEYGVRAGAFVTERHVIAGITGFYVAGSGQVDIDLSNGGKSKLTLDRDGFGFGGEVGWRF